jgi:hypothetical protein
MECDVLSFVLWALTGGALGYLVRSEERHPAALGMVAHVVVGVVSGVLGGLFLSPVFRLPPSTPFGFDFVTLKMFVAIVGAEVSFCALQYRLRTA